jgi:acyl carrier protein
MRRNHSDVDRPDLRDEVFALIRSSQPEWAGELNGETSLIKSGQLDSLGLFNLATYVEEKVGHGFDVTRFNLSEEWDTVDDVLRFIDRQRPMR